MSDPFSPESLRETANMGIAITGEYLREIADHIEQQASKLETALENVEMLSTALDNARTLQASAESRLISEGNLNDHLSAEIGQLKSEIKELRSKLGQLHNLLDIANGANASHVATIRELQSRLDAAGKQSRRGETDLEWGARIQRGACGINQECNLPAGHPGPCKSL